MLGGPKGRSERGGEEKNSQPLLGIEPPITQPVGQRCTTEITQFSKFLRLYNLVNSLSLFKKFISDVLFI
jgi:hypothetical protein